MSRPRVATCLLGLCVAAAWGQAQPDPSGVKFSGYAKTMPVAGHSALGQRDAYSVDANRLRLEWKGPLSTFAAIEVQYDNELLIGNYVRTPDFLLQSRQPRRTYWDLESVYVQHGDVYGRHFINRGALTLTRGDTDLRMGRQRVTWGTGRFWSPLDLLNPVNPIALEPGEREGVDALLLEHKRSAVSNVSFVYAPVHDGRDQALARWHANVSGFDYSFVGGRARSGPLLGADLAGQIGGAGVRAEWSWLRDDAAGAAQRLLLGLDYAFANTLTVTAELYHDGTGASDPMQYDLAGFLAGRRQTLARNYAGAYARFDFTPLVRGESWLVRNLDDRSWYVSPRLTWSVRQSVDLALGAQLFGGTAASEFGRRGSVGFAYAQWFF